MSNTSSGQSTMVQGRIVWTNGDLFKGQVKTEYNSNTPKLDQQGNQQVEYSFGLAVPKEALAQMAPGQPGHIWAVMHEEAQKIYPSGQFPPGFSMKYKDGDGVDHNGKPFAERTGYAGHIVLTCSTTLPIQWFKWENGQNIMVNNGIKCGDYVKAQLQVKAHGPIGQGKPGLYINPLAVQLIGYGEEIINRPSGNDIFGTDMPPVPQGASSTPTAPQLGTPLVPTGDQNGQNQIPQTPAGNPAPAAPYHGVLPASHQPTQGGPAPQMGGTNQPVNLNPSTTPQTQQWPGMPSPNMGQSAPGQAQNAPSPQQPVGAYPHPQAGGMAQPPTQGQQVGAGQVNQGVMAPPAPTSVNPQGPGVAQQGSMPPPPTFNHNQQFPG